MEICPSRDTYTTGNCLPNVYFSLMQFVQQHALPLLPQSIFAVHSSALIQELGLLLKFIQTAASNTSDLPQLLELPAEVIFKF